jgi:hypothetical protein
MPKKEGTVDQFFDAVNEAYDALLDAVKSANDRGYRVSRKVIDEVEQGQRDMIELSRRFALAPMDFAGFSSGVVRSLTDAQSRTLDLARQILDEVSDSGREARDTARKVIEANRGAGQAAVEATRATVKRAGPAVEHAVNGVRTRVTSVARGVGEARGARKVAEHELPGSGTPYEEWTRDALYERATELDIEGRSGMTKDELIRALRNA